MNNQKRGERENIVEFLRKHTRSISILAFVVIVGIIFIPLISRQEDRISSSELRAYVEEFFSEYKRFVYENLNLFDPSQNDLKNFTYFFEPPGEVTGIISRTHGVALFFNSSERKPTEINISTVNSPIEYYVWPNMVIDTSDLPSILIMKAESYYHLTNQVELSHGLLYVEPGANLRYTGEGKAFNISARGAIAIFGSLIEEDRMYLKGSNGRDDWSIRQARFDALDEFLWDCMGVLNSSIIEEIDAKSRLVLLLDRINFRMESGNYRDNPGLFTEDYEDLKRVCQTEQTLSTVLTDYYEMQQTAASFWSPLMTEMTSRIIASLIAGVVLLGLNVYLKRRGII